MGCVYIAKCLVNGKLYVGKTKYSVEHRRKSHEKCAENGSSTHFHNALRKYGSNNFVWETRTESNNEYKLCWWEKTIIRLLRTRSPKGYNMTDGGDGLINPSPEVRAKIGKARRGSKDPPRTAECISRLKEARKKLLSGKRGVLFKKKLSESRRILFDGPDGASLRERIGGGNRGKKFSEEYKQKLRDARKRFLDSPEGAILRQRFSEKYKGRKLSAETRIE